MSFTAAAAIDDSSDHGRRREQRGWYFYDWANSAYVTSVATVLFAPYLTSVAEQAACGRISDEAFSCAQNLDLAGLAISPGSLFFYVITASTLLSALLLPVVGAVADRISRKRWLLAGLAWTGATSAMAMVFVVGTNWQLGALLLAIGNIALGMSLVVYDSLLCEVAEPDERDRVSSRGWALGYLAGGLVLAATLAVVTFHETLGLSTIDAVRISLFAAGLWWAVFTIIPLRLLRDRPPTAVRAPGAGVFKGTATQLLTTLRELRSYPMTMLFLIAYLFYNDGIQTVMFAASVYGIKELQLSESVLIATILVVQFVAFGGALLFGRIATRVGAKRTILSGLLVWIAVIVIGWFLPKGEAIPFLVMASIIGVVLGGTQALSRSLYSQLVPHGREAEFYSLYQAAERGTSWFGTAVFGLVYQLTNSYRPALLALIAFFVIGFAVLTRVDIRRAISDAGNEQPSVV